MTSNEYFTDKEFGPKPRTEEEMQFDAWRGIVSLINRLVSNGSFGLSFPKTCRDGSAIFGTDENSMALAVKAEINELSQWKKEETWAGDEEVRVDYWPLNPRLMPKTDVILDLICFCYRHVAKPIQLDMHSYYNHYHLKFEQREGQLEYCKDINRIFSRNSLMYKINDDGNIVRIPPIVISNILRDAPFKIDDSVLNSMVATACDRYLDPHIDIHRESLEKLWDAWERLKTQYNSNAQKSISKLLEEAVPEPKLRAKIDGEARELNNIGNEFMIRHHNKNQTRIEKSEHIDYLFHRLFALIWLLIKASKIEKK